MDMLGLDTAKLIDTKKLTGITVDKDDLILDPEQILPPPAMRGRLSSIQVENARDLAGIRRFRVERGSATLSQPVRRPQLRTVSRGHGAFWQDDDE